jgi:drug/metabolite transporter (DMT)-like permease
MTTTTTAPPPPVPSRGYLTVLVATLLWSTTPVIIRYLIETQMPPLLVAFWRDVLIAAALVAALSIFRPGLLRLPRRHLPFFVFYGVVLMAFNATYIVSVSFNGASVSTVLVYSAPAFTALISRWLWRESLGPFKTVAIVLSLAGCVFVSGAYTSQAGNLNPAGIAIGLLAGILFAGYNIFGRASSLRGINPWTAVTYSFALASVAFSLPLLLPLADWTPVLRDIGGARDLWWLGRDWFGWGILLVLAWGPSLGGFSLYTVSLGLLPASVVSLIASLEPALTAGLAFLVLGERLTVEQLVGSAMIVGGIMLLRADDLTRARLPSAA